MGFYLSKHRSRQKKKAKAKPELTEQEKYDIRRLVRARNGKLLKVTQNRKLSLKIECRHGHIFDITINKLLRDSWCPICKQHEKELADRGQEQQEYEAGRAYALSILSCEYRPWFHLGEPYLPPMHGMIPYIMEQLKDKYPDLTQEMVNAAVSYIMHQPEYYRCKIHPGPRYRPDGTIAEGQAITPEKAAKHLQEHLHPNYHPSYVIVYTDGGCQYSKDPWRGAWAYAVYDANSMKLLRKDSGSVNAIDRSRNTDMVNFAELTAAIMALYWCKANGATRVDLYTDSLMVLSPKKALSKDQSVQKASDDLLEAITLYGSLCKNFGTNLVLRKVKGHSKVWGNELVDAMCKAEYRKMYRRGYVVMKELAKKRRKPWFQRQVVGTRIYVARKKRMVIRRKDALLRYTATKIGRWMIASGKRLVPRET